MASEFLDDDELTVATVGAPKDRRADAVAEAVEVAEPELIERRRMMDALTRRRKGEEVAPLLSAYHVKLVVGLGNPGREYEATRHNVGWMLLDHLADAWGVDSWRRDGEARVGDARLGNVRVRLLKPLTYMNLSGHVLRPYLRRDEWASASDLLVVVDEVALPLGRYRCRTREPGGHNGLRASSPR